MAPTANIITQDSGGHYTDFDARGNIRTSNLSPYPETTNPFIWEQTHGLFGPPPTYYPVPGGTQSPYSPGNAQQPAPVVNNYNTTIHTMDAQSFKDFAHRNSAAIGEATATHLQNSSGRLADAIQYITNSGRHG